jgi:HEAT repeat protein
MIQGRKAGDKRTMARISRHIENLNSPDEAISSRAEGYLMRYYGARALEPLIEACDHPNPVVRFRALWALAHTRDRRAYDPILRLMRVRYDATVALGVLGDLRAIEPLTEPLLCDDETRPAVMAFIRLGPATIPAMADILRRGNARSRWQAIQVLGNFQDERSLALIKQYCNDPDASVRELADYHIRSMRDHRKIVGHEVESGRERSENVSPLL